MRTLRVLAGPLLAALLPLASACGGGKPPPKAPDADAAFEAAIAAEKEQDAKKEPASAA